MCLRTEAFVDKACIFDRRCLNEEAARPSIAGELALAGAEMFESIFESNVGTSLDDIACRLRLAASSGEHAFTVTSSHFHIPWRMVYTHPDPKEKLDPDEGLNFHPGGFWGYQHIIDEFINNHPVDDRVVARDGKLPLGAALHNDIDQTFQVPCLARHREADELFREIAVGLRCRSD
jgi:hypothetical protein